MPRRWGVWPSCSATTVTLRGMGLPPHDVPTCDDHLHDWVDEVAATAPAIRPERHGSPEPAPDRR